VGVVPVTPLGQNCTLIWDADTRAALVIDPGGDIPLIRERIDAEKLVVERILLTHGHLDHAAGAAALREALGVPLEGPDSRDKFLLDGLEADAARWGLEARNVTPDRFLAEGDRITLGDHVFDVLHVPGHTPGHVVFVEKAARFGQLGDTLFRGSIGRTDFPYGDHAALIAAIRTKLLPLGDDLRFVCGHGPTSTIGDERRTNPFLQD
jgi:glyoxylase-like metal-dependent hydrolase (beta-lactamase superfamily II)